MPNLNNKKTHSFQKNEIIENFSLKNNNKLQ